MKLNIEFIFRTVNGERVAMSVDGKHMVYNNDTAEFVFRRLTKETTEQEIIDAMFEEYDAPKSLISADVHRIINEIRSAGILDE